MPASSDDATPVRTVTDEAVASIGALLGRMTPSVTWSFERKNSRSLARDLLDDTSPYFAQDRRLAVIFQIPDGGVSLSESDVTVRAQDGAIIVELPLDSQSPEGQTVQAAAANIAEDLRAQRRADLDARIAQLTEQRANV